MSSSASFNRSHTQSTPKRLLLLLCGLMLASLGYARGQGIDSSSRIVHDLARNWTFNYFPQSEPNQHWADVHADDSHWPAVALPHSWSVYETTRDLHPFIRYATEREDSYWWYGWGWYRKHLRLSPLLSKRELFLEFDGVQKVAFVYVNGQLVGEHRGGYTSFSFDITPFVRFGQDNVIAVQVSNRRDDSLGNVPPMTAGNFDVYGGVYRGVRLVATNKIYVPFQGAADHEGGLFIKTPSVTLDSATVQGTAWIRNATTQLASVEVVSRVLDATGVVLSEKSTRSEITAGQTLPVQQDFPAIQHPHLWSPSSPYLYRMVTTVRMGSRPLDEYESTFGFRFFRWDHVERKLYLNGKPIQLIGTNRHQDFPWLGDAVPFWLQQTDLEDMRYNLGFNFQRTAHYPQDPEVYDFCDREGILVLEESPNIKDIAFGRDVQEQTMREMVRRDRNHPSIISWGIGNETDHPADSLWTWEEDTSRLINLRRGTNGGDHVLTTDADMGLEQTLRCTIRGWYNDDTHDFTPGNGEPASGQVAGTEEWQHATDARYLSQKAGTNIVVFLYADHGADRIYRNAPLKYVNPKGWVDGLRFPKYVYYLWQANFTTKPMLFIHPWPWQQRYIGTKQTVTIDSNGAEVELFENGASLGTRKPTADNIHVVTFDNVPVQSGELRAVARSSRGTVSEALQMSGAPVRLELRVRSSRLSADRSGLAVLEVSALDEHDIPVPYIHPNLHWYASGAGTLVGPAEYTSDTDKNDAGDGTMYIDLPTANLVRTTDRAGEIKVTVTSPGLKPASITLHSVGVSSPQDGIDEPDLDDANRLPIVRDPGFRSTIITGVPRTFDHIMQDEKLPAGSVKEAELSIDSFLHEHDPRLQRTDRAYQDAVAKLGSLLYENHGNLIADWFNFTADQYEDVEALRSVIEQSSRSAQFKAGLEDNYADRIITNSEPINVQSETKHLLAQLRDQPTS